MKTATIIPFVRFHQTVGKVPEHHREVRGGYSGRAHGILRRVLEAQADYQYGRFKSISIPLLSSEQGGWWCFRRCCVCLSVCVLFCLSVSNMSQKWIGILSPNKDENILKKTFKWLNFGENPMLNFRRIQQELSE